MDLYDDYEDLHTQSPRKPRRKGQVDPAVAADINRRMAAMMVRRMCNQHECTEPETGSCEHPNHRRDNDYLLSTDRKYPGMLEVLGFDTAYPSYTQAEKELWLRSIGQAGPDEEDSIAA
jgi:hypothetical protein